MISDVLHEAVAEIDRYLETMPETYEPESSFTARIKSCRDEMDAIRAALDAPHCLGEAKRARAWWCRRRYRRRLRAAS